MSQPTTVTTETMGVAATNRGAFRLRDWEVSRTSYKCRRNHGGIEGNALDYSVLKVVSGRLTLVKDVDKRDDVVAVSKSGTSEGVFLMKVERLNGQVPLLDQNT